MTANKAAQYDLIAKYYDLFKEDKTDDIDFYRALAHEVGGSVLELACGTGRILLELAAEGFYVTGVEISSGMLAVLHKKLEQKSAEVRERVVVFHGDMRGSLPDQDFALIFVAIDTWFQIESAEDRKKILLNCRKRLKPNGCFALDTFVWDDGQHEGWSDRRPDGRVFYDGSWADPWVDAGVIQRFRSDVMEPASLHLRRTVFCDHVAKNGEIRRFTLTDDEYYVPPTQIEAELREAGFNGIDIYGGFNREELYAPSLAGRGRQVIIARA